MPSKSLIHRKKKASTIISNENLGLLERATILRFENSKFIWVIKILRKICSIISLKEVSNKQYDFDWNKIKLKIFESYLLIIIYL